MHFMIVRSFARKTGINVQHTKGFVYFFVKIASAFWSWKNPPVKLDSRQKFFQISFRKEFERICFNEILSERIYICI